MPVQIRLKQSGWETYTGVLNGLQFTNGLSEEATPRQAAFIANILKVETLDGRNPSDSQGLIDSRKVDLGVAPPMKEGSPETPKPGAPQYTQEELEQIASARGIAGLREIGDKLELRANSINRLIQLILAKQKGEASGFVEGVETKKEPV